MRGVPGVRVLPAPLVGGTGLVASPVASPVALAGHRLGATGGRAVTVPVAVRAGRAAVCG